MTPTWRAGMLAIEGLKREISEESAAWAVTC